MERTRAGDRRAQQRLHLAHRGRCVERGLGARDRDGRVARVGLESVGPRVAAGSNRGEHLARRTAPALAGQLAERARRRAVDGDLHVVERVVRTAVGSDAARVVTVVLGRVPAAQRQVEPTGEGERVVQHDQLLVLARAKRVLVVEPQLKALVARPRRVEPRREPALERVEQRIVPLEHADLELRAPAHERVEPRPELVREVVDRRVRAKPRAAVEVPADDQDAALDPLERLRERGEVAGAIDEERDPARALGAPAGSSRYGVLRGLHARIRGARGVPRPGACTTAPRCPSPS